MESTLEELRPREIVVHRTWRDIYFATILLVVIIAMANLATYFYLEDHLFTPDRWLFQGKWRILQELEKPTDWIVLGDSSGAWGIARDVFEEGISGNSVNLSTAGDTTLVNDAWMLQNYIERFGPPKGVLAIQTIMSLNARMRELIATNTPLEYGYWERYKPAASFDFYRKLHFVLNRYFPLYTQTQNLHPRKMRQYGRFRNRSEISSNGYIEWENSNPKKVAFQVMRRRRRVNRRKLRLSKDNHKALKAIGRMSEKYGFDFYLAAAPVCRLAPQDEGYRKTHAQLYDTIEELFLSWKRLHLVLREPMTFPKDEMQNQDHLIYEAAKRYTWRVTNLVKLSRVRNDKH
ncbi:MAG: hypothetical protein GY854_04220 [Deltaproteobacteria bacterium]|nr:hypothetical protein [Deltaproteobacteria bacterium]